MAEAVGGDVSSPCLFGAAGLRCERELKLAVAARPRDAWRLDILRMVGDGFRLRGSCSECEAPA